MTIQTPQTRPDDRWEVGDDAMCIKNIDWLNIKQEVRDGPKWAEINRVVEVKNFDFLDLHTLSVRTITALRFDRYSPNMYQSTAFRKVEPLSEDEIDHIKVELPSDLLSIH